MSNTNERFARLLTKEMKRQECGVQQLSRQSGVTRAFIYKVLAVEQKPSLEIATKLAEGLGMKVRIAAK